MQNTTVINATPDVIYDTFRNAGFSVAIATVKGEPVGIEVSLNRSVRLSEIETVLDRNGFSNIARYPRYGNSIIVEC